MQADEGKLIARILGGHSEDYAYFMERYGDEVFRLVFRLVPRQEDAEELVQDAFVKAFRHLDSFAGEASFSTWIYRIAYNLTVSWLRKRKVKYLSLEDNPYIGEEEVEELFADASEERIAALERAIGMLKPEEQALVTLYYYRDLPQRDIADILGIAPASIAMKLFRIRKKLYQIICHGKD